MKELKGNCVCVLSLPHSSSVEKGKCIRDSLALQGPVTRRLKPGKERSRRAASYIYPDRKKADWRDSARSRRRGQWSLAVPPTVHHSRQGVIRAPPLAPVWPATALPSAPPRCF
ncbi:hypothetical protein WMY93_018008 [Mugilogobius chulae]|uniref:Uncharacterized protein n=1 Tax=Mugilogobius chulae TaxID=88201 RepID=A0AAW0NUX8_9GOBI